MLKSFENRINAEQGDVVHVEEVGNFEESKKELQETISKNGRVFATFARDASLRYVPSDGFYFLPEKGEIHSDVKWFMKNNFTQEDAVWAHFHEIAHFRDMRENPDDYLDNFEYIRGQAKETAKILEQKYRDQYEQSNPKLIEKLTEQILRDEKKPEKGTMSRLDSIAYEYHHKFFNIMDDIYVNADVENGAPKYSRGSGKELTQNLYGQKLFKEKNYQGEPKHLQFVHSLIREIMTGEECELDEEVKKELNDFMILGKTMNDFVLEMKSIKNPGDRYKFLKEVLEPFYIKLLNEDLENIELPEIKDEDQQKENKGGEKNKNGEQGESDKSKKGESEQAGDPFDPFGKNYNGKNEGIPGPIGEGDIDIEDILEKIKEIKKGEEVDKNMTPEERRKKNETESKAKFDAEYDISPKIRQKFDQRMAEIEPYKKEMNEFWKSLIYGKGRKAVSEKMRGQKRGNVNISDVIEKFPEIEEGARTGHLSELRMKERKVVREVPVDKPELINVRVVGDLSGSMNKEKRKVQEQAILLLLSSLNDFNTYLNISRKDTHSKLKIDTEAWVFGDGHHRIKEFDGRRGKRGQADIINIFKHLNQNLICTKDYALLEEISSEIKGKEQADIKKGKIMEIVFEITDGVPYDGKKVRDIDTKYQVDELTKKGVIVRAFQIGEVDDDDKKTFDDIWNTGVKEQRGVRVGVDIERLPKLLIESMKKYLGNIKI